MLILMVVDAGQAEAVLFGAGARCLAEGATAALMATCPPGIVAALAERIAATGRRFIDAPVSGGVVGAAGGALTIMAAAPRDLFEAARPVLEAWAASCSMSAKGRPGCDR